MPTFPQSTIDAVLHHMNDDHRDDNLLIARAFGDPDAVAAVMTTLDEHGGSWTYTARDEEFALTVPWSGEISERPEIRREIVKLYDTACEMLGITPRPHE